MNVYLAGPMTGKDDLNASKFERAKEYLEMRGMDVTTPFEVASEAGIYQTEENVPELMGYNFGQIRESDAIVFMEGWRVSRGCLAEVAFACRESVSIFELSDNGLITKLGSVGIRVECGSTSIVSIYSEL